MKKIISIIILVLSINSYASEMTRMADLLPTTYYTAQESKVSCKGKYRNIEYDGTEKSHVKTPKGEIIATVCTRFFKVLCMEGSGILADRGHGPITVNWAGKYKFQVQRKCLLGHGVSPRDCLLPHHTVAADLKAHKVGDIFYIPAAKGIKLPDGTIHNGYFIVLDTGGAFRGIGAQRVDLFIGLESDSNNVFKAKGFHHKKPLKAFKISGDLKIEAFQSLKDKFGDLLSDRHID